MEGRKRGENKWEENYYFRQLITLDPVASSSSRGSWFDNAEPVHSLSALSLPPFSLSFLWPSEKCRNKIDQILVVVPGIQFTLFSTIFQSLMLHHKRYKLLWGK